MANWQVCGESHRHKSWYPTEMADSGRSAPALGEPRSPRTEDNPTVSYDVSYRVILAGVRCPLC